MLILGIETSGRSGSLALCEDGSPLATYRFSEGPQHAREIMPGVDDIVRKSDLKRRDIDVVGVSQGPGSFTGLRVGITCAKILAYLLSWKAVGIPSLEVLVQNVDPKEHGVEFACPLRDARRGAAYGTVFKWEADRWIDQTGVLLDEARQLAKKIPEGTLVFGSGVEAYPQVFAVPRFIPGPPEYAEGRGECAAVLAQEMAEKGLDIEPMELNPRYYRPTQVEESVQD
ncbi:MAG: tRNA (adenosine(37)-N6)-threonylcarbamoyltransferase complex dimerization subunit type 1 TsaB [Candidatus Brocadiia bacterium]